MYNVTIAIGSDDGNEANVSLYAEEESAYNAGKTLRHRPAKLHRQYETLLRARVQSSSYIVVANEGLFGLHVEIEEPELRLGVARTLLELAREVIGADEIKSVECWRYGRIGTSPKRIQL